MAPRKLLSPFILFTLLLVGSPSSAAADSDADATALLKLKSSLSNADAALNNWNASILPPCTGNFSNWVGLKCDDGGNVYFLRLENMSLAGTIDIDALVGLNALRSLSFMNNSFQGAMPDVKKLGKLRMLYLSFNRFSGDIPGDAFQGMNSLLKVHLAWNQFTGNIPASLVGLNRLMELSMQGNQFDGEIPDFPQKGLKVFNVADNRLEGRIPATPSNMNSSSFLGNKGLCGKPLGPCKRSKKGYIVIIAILAVAVAALAAIGAFLFTRGRRRTQAYEYEMGQEKEAHKDFYVGQKKAQSTELPGGEYRKGENGKLFFVRNDRDTFDLHDLLRAGAEVLGSGSFGSSYKAILLTGPAVVVKRYRQMNNMGKEQFYDHMRKLGRLSHPNLLPLVAFYFTKEEKLLVSDFVENGSLASHLHANRAPGQPGLDWPTRLKIIKGVARALACLYREFPGLTLPHGHLKSSNVLLDQNFRPLLSEYALVPAVNKEHAQQYMAAYKSPEFTQLDRTTKKTDVWCLGILILELLTGRFPANYLRHGRGENEDLATWVNSVVREEWTGEVFDIDMKGINNSEEEMLKLLKIGMCCCECNVEMRWELREALEKIEELKERDIEEGYYSSCASEGDIYSSRAITEEDFSFLN